MDKAKIRTRLEDKAKIEFKRYKGESNRMACVHENLRFWNIWNTHAHWLKDKGFGLRKLGDQWWIVDYVLGGKY